MSLCNPASSQPWDDLRADLRSCCFTKHMFCLNAKISHPTVQTTFGTSRRAASLPWPPSDLAPHPPPPHLNILIQFLLSFLTQRGKRKTHEALTYVRSDLSCLQLSPPLCALSCYLGLLSTWFQLSLNYTQSNAQRSARLAPTLQHLACNLYNNTNTKCYILSINLLPQDL